MNYLDVYGLQQAPFNDAPAVRFFYNSAQHARALLALMHAIEDAPQTILLTGSPGGGKSTLVGKAIEQLSSETHAVSWLRMRPGMPTARVLQHLAYHFGVESPSDDLAQTTEQIAEAISAMANDERTPVVFVDDAEAIDDAALWSQLQKLLELSDELTLVLTGTSTLSERATEAFGKLEDTPTVELKPLSAKGTMRFVLHRLRVAGAGKSLFDKRALQTLHEVTGGNPRNIVHVAAQALWDGCLRGVDQIDADILETLAALQLHTEASPDPAASATTADTPTAQAEAPASTQERPESEDALLDELMASATDDDEASATAADEASEPAEIAEEEAVIDETSEDGSSEDDSEVSAMLDELGAVAVDEPADVDAETSAAPQEAEPEASATEDDDDIDAMLADLGDDDTGASGDEEAADTDAGEANDAADAGDDDIDAMLADLGDDDTGASGGEEAADTDTGTGGANDAADAGDDDIDAMLDDLGDDDTEQSGDAQTQTATSDDTAAPEAEEDDDEIEIDLDVDEAEPDSDSADSDDDIDAMLADLGDDDVATEGAETSAQDDAQDDDDIDAMLADLEPSEDEEEKTPSKSQQQKSEAHSEGLDDLDDLLDQLDELDN